MSSSQPAGHAPAAPVARAGRAAPLGIARAFIIGSSVLCAHFFMHAGQAHAEPVILHDVELIADSELIRGTEATVYVATRGATDLTESRPLANAEVSLTLASAAKTARTAVDLATARTRDDGTAVLRFDVPRALAEGAYVLIVRTRSQHGQGEHRQSVTVSDATTLHVRTDRGIYRPGQTLRWRVSAVNTANAHPLAEVPVEVSITDPNGTAIWSGRVQSNATGMVHGEVPLDTQLILGRYTVFARMGKVEASTQVAVRAYKLPAFTVEIEPETEGPYALGATVRGHVLARYLQGEPVSGRVELSGSGLSFEPHAGELDAHGRMRFSASVTARAGADIRAAVTDGAERTQRGTLELPLVAEKLELSIIPERTPMIAGERQFVTILTTDGHGRFAPAELRVDAFGQVQTVSSRGAVRVAVEPRDEHRGQRPLHVHAKAGALLATEEDDVQVVAAGQPYVRPSRAIIEGGAAFEVEGRWSKSARPLVIALLREGTPVATAVARPDSETGRFKAHLQPPPGVFGLATVRVTDARWNAANGDLTPVYAQATVWLRPTRLDIELSGQTRYRPGETAHMQVAVHDHAGRPVAGAGLAASVVDERVLLLAEPGPDLALALRQLGMGQARAAGLAFAELLAGPASTENRLAMRALVEALPPDTTTPAIHIDAAERVRDEIARMGRVREAVYRTLLTDARAIGVPLADGGWEFAHPLDKVLTRAGWKARERETPWRETMDWQYARRLRPDLTFDKLAPDIATERLDRLAGFAVKNKQALFRGVSPARLATQGKMPRYVTVDPWGTAIRVQSQHEPERRPKNLKAISAGPDRVFDTSDDIVREDLLGLWGTGYGYGSGYGGMRGRHAGTVAVRGGTASVNEDVAVRRNFDQTVLWQTGLETDARGRYTLDIPLADSITGWRVEVLALSRHGAIGSARAHIETALPLYMDADLPHALTLGDRYHLPVIVGNHGDRQKTLLVQPSVSGSLALAASARGPKRVTLPAGATAMVAVEVRARGIGRGVIDLTLSEPGPGTVLDRTQHTIDVNAPGRLERAVHTAKNQDGRLHMAFTVPADHTPGTTRGALRLYRGVADQALDGLEGLLREPHGCFEQTSSSTYPNLLVLRLLGDKDETRAARERARELVGKGYQRLISYEVAGGGFSWFGDAPANQILTAYGLMEFVDMAAVYPVDPALIERTRTWLLSKQQADGSWTKDPSWLHDWSAVQGKVSTTAYIAWALAESGYRGKELERAFGFLRAHRQELADDPYLLALWSAAESAHQKGRNPAISLLREKVQRDDTGAYLSAGGQTLFYTTGKAADAQVTALGVVALGRLARRPESDVKAALEWLWNARDERSGWGTTQGTVLALRAYAELSRQEPARGRVHVRLDGALVGTLALGDDSLPTLDLPGDMPAGRHDLTIEPAREPAGGEPVDLSAVRADVRTAWRTGPAKQPVSSGLGITLSASTLPVHVGERVDLRARLSNPGQKVLAMPTVVIPVPPGFTAVQESLDALERSGAVDHAEDQGSEIHLYLSRLDAGATVDLPYRLEATAACTVTQRSAQAYAYYDPDTRGASAELTLRALPRK